MSSRAISFVSSGWYTPERCGPLEEYLKTHNGVTTFPLFKGYRYYKEMKRRGYLVPGFTTIRLMWNIVRDDEYFIITDDFQLQGLDSLPAHAGRPGIHDPKKILSRGPCWEVNHFRLPEEADI